MRNRALEPLEPRRLLTLLIDYPMEEGSGRDVADAATFDGRQDATLEGVATWTFNRGRVPSGSFAVSLNGTDASLMISEDIGWKIGHSATVSAWIKTTDVGTRDPASSPGLLGADDGPRGSIYWGWIDDCGRINLTVPGTPPPGGRDTVTSIYPINDNTWHHVVMTRDINSGEISLYVDGFLHDRTLADTTPRDSVILHDIGYIDDPYDGETGRYLNASIDEFRVYDEVLSGSGAATEFDPRGAEPMTPTNVHVPYVGGRTIMLAWDPVVGASSYEVWRSLAGSGTFAKVALAPPKGEHIDSGLERSTSYEYRIRAVNPFGESAFSATVTGTTVSPQWDAPVIIRGSEGDDTIRVEVRGQEVHVWNSAEPSCSCACEGHYRVASLADHDGIRIEGLGGSDNIHVEVAAGSRLDEQSTISGGAGHDDVRVSGAGFFIVGADTGLDDLTLGRGAIVDAGRDQQFGSWVFDGPGTIGIYGTTSIRSITPHADARVEIGSATLRLLDSPERDVMLRRLETMAATARAATPPWSGPRGLTSSRVNSPLIGIAVGTETKVAYNGDANLDGRINSDDYFAIDSGFLTQPADPLYTQGDFNYDGRVNSDDYFLIDSAFLGQTGPLHGFEEVPPPGTAVHSLATRTSSSPAIPFSRQRVNRTTRPRRASPLAAEDPDLLIASAPLLP